MIAQDGAKSVCFAVNIDLICPIPCVNINFDTRQDWLQKSGKPYQWGTRCLGTTINVVFMGSSGSGAPSIIFALND